MRYTGPKVKLCRREGINLFGTEKYDLSKNNRAPLSRGFGRASGFAQQLRKKQAAKRMYGLSEKQFSNYFKKASKKLGNTADHMLRFLDTRLDVVIFKSNFARTIMQARQFVNHGHVMVNGTKVDIPSYQIKVGDVIEVRDNKKDLAVYKTLTEEFEAFLKENKNASLASVDWLKVDPKKLTITVERLPEAADFDKGIDVTKIIEFYSK